MPAAPDLIWLVAALLVGFALGLFPAILLAKSRIEAARQAGRQELSSDLAILDERLANRNAHLQRLELQLRDKHEERDKLIQERTELVRQQARLSTELKEETRRSAENLQILNDAKQELQIQFENLANQIFAEKTRTFADQSKANLDTILTPFKEKIVEFEKKITEVYTTEGRERHSLIKEVQRLQELNQKIGEDAANLTKALKGDTRTQGAWGEIILERILEESGLRKGIEYDSQGGFRDAGGKLFKPDVVVHLPDEKDIIIDSKVSLVAYEKYVRSEDAEERLLAVKEHLLSINAHLKNLETKRYDELPGIKSLDFVLMFIPIESAFMLAIDKDSEIFRKAFDQNIMIVSPSTLLVTMRTIQNIWRYENQNKNALEIAEKAGNLYDKFVGFVADLEKIGDHIDNTQKAYDGAHNKLISGKGSLISRTQTLIELGVKSRKQLPASVMQRLDLETPLIEQNEISAEGLQGQTLHRDIC
ncbi:MAG: DNA recombination protein RmuC [Desulfuromonadales bacterium]|nr:DNA recombination protein RmuC [Desulfuromonadales bacterium]